MDGLGECLDREDEGEGGVVGKGGRRRTDGDHPFGVQTACDDSRSMSGGCNITRICKVFAREIWKGSSWFIQKF